MTSSQEHDFSSTAGYVYVLSNPSMQGIVKIGSTERNVKERVTELSATTGVPTPFVIECSVLTENPKDLEFALHDEFDSFRVNGNREFFSLPVESVTKRLLALRGKLILAEIQRWEETAISEFAYAFKSILPENNYLQRIAEANNADLLKFLSEIPNQSVVRVLEKLFQNKPEIWRELR
ncbi:MAG: hypothetical protein RL459_1483 [Pseudomonadota bacterium]|jgi:hypothetical protein